MGSNMAMRDGWTRLRFGDVVENVNDQPKRSTLPLDTRYIAGEHVDENRLTIDRWGTLGDDLVPPTFKRRFRAGDVLFHSRNLKKIAVPDFGGITGEKLFVLRSTSPDLLQEFVPYVLLSPKFTAYAEASWSGSVNKFLNWTPLAKYEFDLPPVEEQRALVSTLTPVGEAVRASAIALTASGVLFRAFADHHVALVGSDIPLEPLVAHLDVLTVGIVVKPAALYVAPAEDGVVALRSLNITPHKVVLNDVVRISREGHASHSKSALRAGDVAVVRTGRPGDAAVIPDDLHDVNCIDLIIMRPRSSLNPHFLALFLNSTAGRTLFSSGATGTAQQHFNIGACRQLKLAVPARSVQDAIVDAAKAILESAQAIQARHDAAICLQKRCIATGTQL